MCIYYILYIKIISMGTAAPYEVPSGLHLAKIVKGKLTFRWTPPSSSCLPTYYGIQSDCGNCSRRTTQLTTAICSDLYLSPDTAGSICTFSVYSVFCNDTTGNPSTTHPVIVTLRGQPFIVHY
jgi:hypothetical protein